ncbi:bifunctional metallophosphatase/5'-nucleotidase [Paenibacillus doosanensis]|uniref:Trifunctional nucleotide phosphoesterase protein YfkN n=1 Tax=Paenibacillus konkukensis TaxID=2020716 RepID=A0ABY4RM20_9BACL|nr:MULTISPECIES: bifunctional UDP-sugar hydrolase/5'-nucleotidase [Paenibacillus]MCS7462404.1 bifunctional metallophosphatase/5'-nucleotidase [Paenibacillus doosanensis]UQZ83213.1 Trifunctional nucleotide phosphoesterase protein YfkN precursor [Paenibacillus konkukensis]
MTEPIELTILYTNDFHAQDKPVKATWIEGEPMMGGAAYMASYINKVRAGEPNVLVLDAGDIITGPAISFLTSGEAPVDLFNAIGIDASCIGNHEFDHGVPNARKLVAQAQFPFLSGSIFYKGTNILFAKPYEILEKGGLKIGVIGIHGKKAGYETIQVDLVRDLDFREQESLLQEYVNLLRPHVDLVIVLAHEGVPAEQSTTDREVHVEEDFEEDVRMCSHVKGIDLMITGHAHKSIAKPYVVKETGTLLCSTRGLGTFVGYLKLRVDKSQRRIVSYEGHLEPIYSDRIEPDPAVEARVQYWDDRLKQLIDQKIGYAEEALTRNYFGESVLGNIITDAIRLYTEADVAFTNPGGLRADVDQGDITVGHIISVVPFNNNVLVMEMTGRELREVLEQSAGMNAGVLEQSGVTMVVDPSAEPGSLVSEALIGGLPLDENRIYKVASDDFTCKGGDGFTAFAAAARVRDTSMIMRDLVIEHIRKLGTIRPQLEDRIVVVPPLAATT